MITKISKIKKFISCLVAVCFFISFELSNAVCAIPLAQPVQQKVLDLPSSIGTITTSKNFGTQDIIVNIQDLHCHPQTQKNIAKIIEEFNKIYNINEVYLEGASSNIDTTWLSNIKNTKIGKDFIDLLVDNGKMGGVEYYSVINNKTNFIKGIENKKLYDENIKLLSEILVSSNEIEKIYSQMEQELKNIKVEYFSKKVKRIDNITTKYHNKQIEVVNYFNELKKISNKDLGNNYFALKSYLKMLEIKNSLNYNQVKNELKFFMSDLKNNIPYTQYVDLLNKSDNFTNIENIVNDLVGYKQIYAKYSLHHLDQFLELLQIKKDINPILFIEQEQNFIETTFNNFAKNKYEKDIVFISEFLPLIKNYFTAKITPKEYFKFNKDFNKFKQVWNNYSTTNSIVDLDKFVSIVSKYHSNNLKRDEIFTKKLIGNLKTNLDNKEISKNVLENVSNKNIKIVVTGGFHSQGLEEIFNNSKVSYVIVTPKTTGEIQEDNQQYLSIVNQYSQILENTINVPTITETILLESILPEILPIILKAGKKYSDLQLQDLVNELFQDRIKQNIQEQDIKDIKFNIEDKDGKKLFHFVYTTSKNEQKELLFNDNLENITPSNKATIVRDEKSILNKLGFVWEEIVFRIAPYIVPVIAGLSITNPVSIIATLISGIILFPLAHNIYDKNHGIKDQNRFKNLFVPSTIATASYLSVSMFINPIFAAIFTVGLHFIYNYFIDKNIGKRFIKLIEPIVAGLPQKSTYIKKYFNMEDIDWGSLANNDISSVIVIGKPTNINKENIISISYPLENEQSKSIKVYMEMQGNNPIFFIDCSLAEFNIAVELFSKRVNSDSVVKAKVFSFLYPTLFSQLGKVSGLTKGHLAKIGDMISQRIQTGFEMPIKLPEIFSANNISIEILSDTQDQELIPIQQEIAKKYPYTKQISHPVKLSIGKESQTQQSQSQIKTVAFVLSGGPAAGGHNVISGLYRSLKESNPDIRVLGFIQGPGGILKNTFVEITDDVIEEYINTGGFNMTITDRTKLTADKFARVQEVFEENEIDSLVVIGGDDSNTNAADLAEFFANESSNNPNARKISVIGVPKTIDGDLKNKFIETSFGFDTATKLYSYLISNVTRDQLSTAKMWAFVSLMGRKASHVTLEAALKTNPDVVLIGEKVKEENMSLSQVVDIIVEQVVLKSQKGQNYGLVLVPEGLIEFIPEFNDMLLSLTKILTDNIDSMKTLNRQEKTNFALSKLKSLDSKAYALITSMPVNIINQLTNIELDAHGNIPVSQISTSSLLSDMVEAKLDELKKQGIYKAKYSAITPFYGYEGRSTEPSDFDKTYTFALGYTAGNLILNGVTGAMATVQNLEKPVSQWQCGGYPLVDMMTIEERKGQPVPVIEKALLDPTSQIFKVLDWTTQIRAGAYRIVMAPQTGIESSGLPITLMFEKLNKNVVDIVLSMFDNYGIEKSRNIQQVFETLRPIIEGMQNVDSYLQKNNLLEFKKDIFDLVEYLNNDNFNVPKLNVEMLSKLGISISDVNMLKILKLIDDFSKNSSIQNKALETMNKIKDVLTDELPVIDNLIEHSTDIEMEEMHKMLASA